MNDSKQQKECPACEGVGVVDDRGYPLRGQPFFDTEECTECKGTGKAEESGWTT